MHILIVVFMVLFQASSMASNSDNLHLDPDAFTGNTSFLPHRAEHRFGTYLTMNLQFAAFDKLRKQVESSIGRVLSHRGEAHVTVITPLEYFDVLKKKLTIREIEIIAHRFGIQDSGISAKCVGKGSIVEQNEMLDTYFLVVDSQKLLQIRREISKEFALRGGNLAEFDSEKFYPHVTLGFTERDLHISDGVVKDERSCWQGVIFSKSR